MARRAPAPDLMTWKQVGATISGSSCQEHGAFKAHTRNSRPTAIWHSVTHLRRLISVNILRIRLLSADETSLPITAQLAEQSDIVLAILVSPPDCREARERLCSHALTRHTSPL